MVLAYQRSRRGLYSHILVGLRDVRVPVSTYLRPPYYFGSKPILGMAYKGGLGVVSGETELSRIITDK